MALIKASCLKNFNYHANIIVIISICFCFHNIFSYIIFILNVFQLDEINKRIKS